MTRPEEKRPRCSYYDALAAIGLMKGIPMIDVARDDALISALMEMEPSDVRRIVALYDRETLGYPTPEKIATLTGDCDAAPAQLASAPGLEPRRCIQIVPIRSRLIGVFWGMVSGVVSTLTVAWMTAAPWFEAFVTWLATRTGSW